MDADALFRDAVTACFIASAPLVLLGVQFRSRLPTWLRRAHLLVVLASIAVLARYMLRQVHVTIDTLPEWHIRAFWLYGRTAVTGGNFYLPEALQRTWQNAPASPAFTREILEVGFPYPPATMLLLAPLGHLTLRQAAWVWQGVSVASVLATIVLLRRAFLPGSGAFGLAVTTALVLGFTATHWTIELTQSSNLVLLFVTLAWTLRDRPSGAVMVALGTMVKPIVALLGLYFLLRRDWRSVALAAGTYVALTLGAIGLFGWQRVGSFLSASPLARMPGWMYTGHNSQSILAVALRASGVGALSRPLLHPLANPLFLGLAGAVLAATILLMYALSARGDRLSTELAMAINVCAALLLYPNTLNHYAVLLLPPLFFFWTRSADLRVPRTIAAALVSCAYWLVLVNQGDSSVLAMIVVWCALSIVGTRLVARSRGGFEVLPPNGLVSHV
jgi:hypothetical protein